MSKTRLIDEHRATSGDLAVDVARRAEFSEFYNGFNVLGHLLFPSEVQGAPPGYVPESAPWYYGDELAGALNLLEPA